MDCEGYKKINCMGLNLDMRTTVGKKNLNTVYEFLGNCAFSVPFELSQLKMVITAPLFTHNLLEMALISLRLYLLFEQDKRLLVRSFIHPQCTVQ